MKLKLVNPHTHAVQEVLLRLNTESLGADIEGSLDGKCWTPLVGVRTGEKGIAVVRWNFSADNVGRFVDFDQDNRIRDMFK